MSGTVKGQTINYCVVEYDYAQKTWIVHSMSTGTIGSVFATFIDSSSAEHLYAGSATTASVYKLYDYSSHVDQNSTGSNTQFTTVYTTKNYEIASNSRRYRSWATNFKNINNWHFKYYADAPITIEYSLDGAAYQTLPATLPTASTNRWAYNRAYLGSPMKIVGLRLSCAGKFTIFGIGYEVDDLRITGSKGI